MFIVAKRNYLVRRADGSFYRIEKDYIGEIPEDVAESELVQRAIVGGNIAVPGGIRDRELYKADDAAAERSVEYDIRPDAEKTAAEKNVAEEEAKKSVKAKSTKKE